MRPIQEDKARSAVVQLRQGKSVREVSSALGISLGTVSKLRQGDKENIPKPKEGRPSKVSAKTKAVLARKFDSGQLLNIREGQRLVQAVEGVQVHKETIRNYLNSEGLKAYVQQKKPMLTKKHKEARFRFAKEHIHWTVDDWKWVMFSDETIISRVGSFGRKFYYKRAQHKLIQEHQIKKTKQGGGGKIMIWGCMTYFGVGDACWHPGRINAEAYITTLNDYVLQSRDWYDIDPDMFIFQHDNASVHTARSVKDFIEDVGITVMEWPANSPDLNPIEHVWGYIKRELDAYSESPKTMDELWERIQEIWTSPH